MKETLHCLIRVSSSAQEAKTSLLTQKKHGIELAERLKMNYQIHNEGGTSSSGDSLVSRPVLLNLLKLMDDGVVRHLYVWNTDRLSRNQITWYTIRQKMIKNGVILYTANGVHDSQDFMENMVLGILSEVSQYDNRVRAERSRLGKIEMVKLNFWQGGDCPFGYTLHNEGRANKLAIHSEESKWIQYIFQCYAKGITLKDIKSALEKNGIRTRRDNIHWSLGSLQAILRNDIYLGVSVFRDKKSGITIKNNIPQIIPDKLWEDVQDRRRLKLLRKNQINKTKHFYLFRDFLICKCGTPMSGRIKKNGSVQHYYCPLPERKFNAANANGDKCDMKKCMDIPTANLQLWNKIVDILSDTVSISNALREKTLIGKLTTSPEVQSIIREKEEIISGLTQKKQELEKALVTVETDNLLERYASNEIYSGIKKNLNKEYKQTNSKIEELRNSLKQLGNDTKWYDWLDNFGKAMGGHRNIPDDQKRHVLDAILENIVVDYDHDKKLHRLDIRFKLPVCIASDSGGYSSTPLYTLPVKLGESKSKTTSTKGGGIGTDTYACGIRLNSTPTWLLHGN